MNNIRRSGPKTLPWDTPLNTGRGALEHPFIETEKRVSDFYKRKFAEQD